MDDESTNQEQGTGASALATVLENARKQAEQDAEAAEAGRETVRKILRGVREGTEEPVSDPAKRVEDVGPGESLAEVLDKADLKALARLLRRAKK